MHEVLHYVSLRHYLRLLLENGLSDDHPVVLVSALGVLLISVSSMEYPKPAKAIATWASTDLCLFTIQDL